MNGRSQVTTMRVLMASGVLALGISSFALAGNSPNSGGSGAGAKPEIVASTTAGMPVTAQVRFAVVKSDGTKARSFPSNVTAAADAAPGGYIVTFGSNVSGCAYNATLGLPGNVGVESGGEISVQTANVNPNAVYVYTRDSAGNPAPRNFHLSVNC